VMGAFPVQSNTGCLTELVNDGETALIVPPEDPAEIAAAIRRALSDDALVDRAAELNARLAAERLDYQVIQPRVVEMYERIAAEIRAPSAA
jgi:glycosyltransferase involved in cell wall biosynthesis